MMRRVAYALGDIASRMLPKAHRQWGDAMIAEIGHADADRAALGFAIGCVVAALRARVCDGETRFSAGLWSIALLTAFFAVLRFQCAVNGVPVLLGAPDGMEEALLQHGASRSLIASYQAGRPFVILCFLALGCAELLAAWFLSRRDYRRFLGAWFAAFSVAVVAVAIQLSIVWSAPGLPSEFHALLMQAIAVPTLLAWPQTRHDDARRMQ
ncbi:MAG: hypothetical protein K2X59_02725 [Sphingomonas sp.]|nr:hypothetical protein [Sphingomonas sp.]